MLIYIIKSSACLAIFLVIYKLFLEKESVHHFKRFYLLSSIGLAFAIPLLTFTQYVTLTNNIDTFQSPLTEPILNLESTVLESFNSTIVLWAIYCIGVLFFSAKFIFNISILLKRIKDNLKFKTGIFTNVLLKDIVIPHTFFNFIFFNKGEFESKKIPREVLLHEQTHAVQKHSIDIIFIELIQILTWFNPLIYLVKHFIKLNHEFLADQAVLKEGIQTSTYQSILLSFTCNTKEPLLANAINYSLIKKRFTIMKTKSSKRSLGIKTLFLLPLVAFTLYGFSNKKTIIINNSVPDLEEIYVQKKATKEQIKEYNRLAKHYNSQPADQLIIKQKDLERLKYLYHLMSEEQRENVEEFPVVAPPPAPKPPKSPEKAPTVLEIKVTPPPPPPIPDDATPEQKKKYKDAIKLYKQKIKLKNKKKSLVEVREIASPAVPLAPKPPLDHVIEMAKKGAIFYFEGEKISSDSAIALLKRNNKINISTKASKSKQPVVHLSIKPIVIEN